MGGYVPLREEKKQPEEWDKKSSIREDAVSWIEGRESLPLEKEGHRYVNLGTGGLSRRRRRLNKTALDVSPIIKDALTGARFAR